MHHCECTGLTWEPCAYAVYNHTIFPKLSAAESSHVFIELSCLAVETISDSSLYGLPAVEGLLHLTQQVSQTARRPIECLWAPDKAQRLQEPEAMT